MEKQWKAFREKTENRSATKEKKKVNKKYLSTGGS